MTVEEIASRTFDMTSDELFWALGTRHVATVIFTHAPFAPDKGSLPTGVRVMVPKDGIDARLSALRMARAAIDFLIVQVENGGIP